MQLSTYAMRGEKKKMLCYLPVLYVWLASCICERVTDIKCPVEVVIQQGPEVKGEKDWAQLFAGLNEIKAQW